MTVMCHHVYIIISSHWLGGLPACFHYSTFYSSQMENKDDMEKQRKYSLGDLLKHCLSTVEIATGLASKQNLLNEEY